MLYDSTFVLIIPALILSVWAQAKVRSAYAKYSQVPNIKGLTGSDVAQYILRDAGITVSPTPEAFPRGTACGLAAIPGKMTDHYDPRDLTVSLSEDVFRGRSIAALGIAAHEVGHAIQHAKAYAPLSLRNVVYPVCSLGTTLAWPLFILGFFMRLPQFMGIGILLFTFAVFFTVLTLPVEFNASRRALRLLEAGGYLDAEELAGARKVLSAAAMTYVAAAAMAILNLVRMLALSRD